LWKVRGRYEESMGAMEVIGCQEKSVVASDVTCCYANSLAAIERSELLWKVSGRWGKSVVALLSH
jgi:hypothetical protein